MTILPALRIAFFGSDKFSVTSLRRLYDLHERNPLLVSSIKVITRSIKPTGRNLKNMVDVPIGEYAQQRGIQTFRSDSLSQTLDILDTEEFDLAVAVSYGKLIPGGFLNSMKYGGLNVHPSLLPMYRGSSPIQYALMDDLKETGVSLQTLHPTKFDHGLILLQSQPVSIREDDNFISLSERLGEAGAELLTSAIEKGLYADPVKPLQLHFAPSLAPKITPKMAQIDWNKTARQIKRLSDALGPLHVYKEVDITKKKKRVHELQKVIINDISISHTEQSHYSYC
ncbi:methionyl-tRNA formyltransferase [Candidozyma pseudohaemuli]|uniref:methionyl-tRNA formyltransferase n=1 Tax=Candidozyma pseudohaemuli TaxID=418784 RepID=A0A2P7YX92_9ASCO|nr:methionyl-tRNA formyltransferase [[Candida] pseudohaemulonii]PSK40590.1 methionyl-tRNA formyltransferase [[Candida] pseudohaemulonii]